MAKTSPPQMSFLAGPGGWAEVSWRGVTAFVRFKLNADRKTWRIVELRLDDPSDEALRKLSLARIEKAVNAGALTSLELAIGHKGDPPADLRKHFSRARKTAAERRAAGRFLLERPEGRRLDDAFYARVAMAYGDAVKVGLNPRQTLAQDCGAAPDTVARWVAEARRRGFLRATKPGKVTV